MTHRRGRQEGDRSPGGQSRRLSRYRWAPYTCLSEPAGKFSPDASSRDIGGLSTHVGDNRRKRDISPVVQEKLPTCLERCPLTVHCHSAPTQIQTVLQCLDPVMRD